MKITSVTLPVGQRQIVCDAFESVKLLDNGVIECVSPPRADGVRDIRLVHYWIEATAMEFPEQPKQPPAKPR